jgi:hypothetical protein
MMWTTAVLSLLMPPDEAETVAGDLIEEYRDTVYPAAGKWRADFWLARQVAGFVWRVPLAWGLLVAVFIAGRFVADTLAPPASYAARSFFTTWSSILLYLMAGAWGARRTGRLLAGVLLAAGAHAIGWTLSGVVTIALFAGVIRNEPAMLNLFYATGGWGEQWFLPLMLLPIVLSLGAIGGVFGRTLGRRIGA